MTKIILYEIIVFMLVNGGDSSNVTSKTFLKAIKLSFETMAQDFYYGITSVQINVWHSQGQIFWGCRGMHTKNSMCTVSYTLYLKKISVKRLKTIL